MSEMPKDIIPDTGTRANHGATSERTVLIRRIALDSTDPFSTEREIMIHSAAKPIACGWPPKQTNPDQMTLSPATHALVSSLRSE